MYSRRSKYQPKRRSQTKQELEADRRAGGRVVDSSDERSPDDSRPAHGARPPHSVESKIHIGRGHAHPQKSQDVRAAAPIDERGGDPGVRRAPIDDRRATGGATAARPSPAKFDPIKARIPSNIDELIEQISDGSIDALPPDALNAMYNKFTPYGRTIEGADEVVTMSYTDLDGRYKLQLLMTAVVGFLFRKCEEWQVPDGHPTINPNEYLRECIAEKTTQPTKFMPTAEEMARETPRFRAERETNFARMRERLAIMEFLEDAFQFNPDEHARAAYKPNPADKTRGVVRTPAADIAINAHCRKNPAFRDTYNIYLQKLAEGKIKRAAKSDPTGKSDRKVEVDEKGEPIVAAPPIVHQEKLLWDMMTPEDVDPEIMAGRAWQLEHIVAASGASSKPAPGDTDVLAATRVRNAIPPEDTFHRVFYYLQANYEALVGAVHDLYGVPPVFEAAINAYATHKTVDDADKFIAKHKDNVIATIHKIHTGKWNIIAPYRVVRDSTRYFNDKTLLLEEILKNKKADEQLGAELMQNMVRKKKKKNVIEDGPDAKSFEQWKKTSTQLRKLGVTEIKQEDECPTDAVEVGVFTVKEGGRQMQASKFYTKAAPPELPTAEISREPAKLAGSETRPVSKPPIE